MKALEEALDALDLPEVQREQLKARYVYYVGWLERSATGSRRGHYWLRLTAAVGSVFVASMSSAQVLGSSTPRVVSWILLGTSLAIGVALAIDGFMNLGDRWRHYRAGAERFKGQGWLFIQRLAPYAGLSDTDAARAFAGDVEKLISEEINEYVTGPARPATSSTSTS